MDEPVFDHPFLSQRQVDVGTDVTERDMQRATAAYYGMIETIDEYYGIVLDALEAAGQNLNDWIIIYTSDHGEMLGQHGIWEKQKFFEASVGVPLFIRWPAGFGAERAHGDGERQPVRPVRHTLRLRRCADSGWFGQP